MPVQGPTAAKVPEQTRQKRAPVVYRSQAEGTYSFEYLDHTADIQFHAWGKTFEEALASTALAMYNYMTPLEGLEGDAGEPRQFEAEGHDMHTMIYAFLDELLFTFCTELFVCTSLKITSLDREAWKVTAEGRGHTFDRNKHASGTEIKAITYSAMQVREEPGDAEIFVIVDI